MVALLTALAAFQGLNAISPQEAKQGWKLLFDGQSTTGWHGFQSGGVGVGWKVEDGVLICADPGTAGDIMTSEKFDWFELVLEFNLAKGGNSGVMYHVAEDGEATWHSGPEIQLYDHPAEAGQEITGYLYQLYASKVDASKPAGQWNSLRIMVSPKKCWTAVNGVKYYEYVLGSPDFWARVAKSKFAQYPQFAKLNKGAIAIQGDHGVVSFRNIKIRPIKG
jgi:hypothetical protein